MKGVFKDYELRRKAMHFTIGVCFVVFINFYRNLDYSKLEFFLLAGLLFSLLLSIYTKYKRPKFLMDFLKIFDKPKDLEKFPGKGAVYYIIGILIAIMLFDKNTASACILILAIGDPAAHIFGRYYGRNRLIINKKKLLEGTLAGIFLGTVVATIFVPFPIAFFGAAFGMMAEAFELEVLHIDDNFFIPFVSGIVMTMIESLL